MPDKPITPTLDELIALGEKAGLPYELDCREWAINDPFVLIKDADGNLACTEHPDFVLAACNLAVRLAQEYKKLLGKMERVRERFAPKIKDFEKFMEDNEGWVRLNICDIDVLRDLLKPE